MNEIEGINHDRNRMIWNQSPSCFYEFRKEDYHKYNNCYNSVEYSCSFLKQLQFKHSDFYSILNILHYSFDNDSWIVSNNSTVVDGSYQYVNK